MAEQTMYRVSYINREIGYELQSIWFCPPKHGQTTTVELRPHVQLDIECREIQEDMEEEECHHQKH